MLVTGRLIAGVGIGFVSAIIILYLSEIAPKAVRGAIVSGYQFAITLGLFLAACVDQGTHARHDSGCYRIPMAVQWVWALILALGLAALPESPRWFVMKGKYDRAALALARLRGQPVESEYIKDELAELVANMKYESDLMKSSWLDCFTGGWAPSGNLRKVLLGMAMQMMQQWTGVNFICE
jgi:MFS family permease